MTEREICSLYRQAKRPSEQIKILSDLTLKSNVQIIGILLKNRQAVPKKIINELFERMDKLDIEIATREREYIEIAKALKGENDLSES